jgi:hypothetical protein
MGIILRSFNYCTMICCWCCWAIATLVSSHELLQTSHTAICKNHIAKRTLQVYPSFAMFYKQFEDLDHNFGIIIGCLFILVWWASSRNL